MQDGIGRITRPSVLANFPGIENGAIGVLLSIFTTLLITGAGIYALFNFILAGYSFMSAGDDPNKIAGAWAKIYQTIIGLAFSAGAFVLASIVGRLLFGDWAAITDPVIPTI